MSNEQANQGGPQNRRRTRLISPSFQWRYAATIAMTVAVCSCLLSVVLFAILHEQARTRLIDPANSTPKVTAVLVLFCGGLSLLMGGVAAVASVVLSHRICGPVIVLQNYLTQLATGKLPHVRQLRRADEFKELMSSFRNVVTAIENRQTLMGRCLDEVLDNADAMVARPADAKNILANLRTKVDQARQQFVCRAQPARTENGNQAMAPAGAMAQPSCA